jgi:hypothetical protein
MTQEFYGFDDDMFSGSQKISFHSFKNGEHKFRVLPPFEKGRLFLQVDLHWGFTDENGRKKALRCTKYSHKACPICDEVDRIKGEVELLKTTIPTSPDHKRELDKQIAEKESRIGDIKKKPTYLWNILTENGEQKVLQLSWNGHDPLHQKIKFFWEQKKINVTDPRANYLIWVSRTGEKAKTRYQYEVLEQTVRQLEGLKPLVDLTKVYKESSPAELKAIVSQGFVGMPTEDPNDRSFEAMPAGLGESQAPQSAQQQQTINTPAPQEQVASPAQTSAPQTLSSNAAQTADEEAERLMRALQG